jgi:hypothetical protein
VGPGRGRPRVQAVKGQLSGDSQRKVGVANRGSQAGRQISETSSSTQCSLSFRG